MKKFTTLLFFVLFIFTAKAQALQTVEVADGEAWWGYCDILGGDSYRTVGTNLKETCDVAMFVPGTTTAVVCNNIKAIRIFFEKKTGVKDVKVWLSTTLPSSAAQANIVCKSIDDADIRSLADDNEPIEIMLDAPYLVTDKGVYVGYSFTTTDDSNLMPIVVTKQGGIKNSFFLHSSSSFASWDDMNSMGASAMQILIAGEVKQDAVSVSDFGDINAEVNKPAEVRLSLTNAGTNVVNNISYSVSIDGKQLFDSYKTVDFQMRANDEERTLIVPLGTFTEEGNHNVSVEIVKVNGVDNTVSATASGVLHILSALSEWHRKVLIEEFTTEPCPNCPTAAARLRQAFEDYPELNSQAIVVCHHAAFGTDWLTIAPSESYIWFFGGTGTMYAPAFMYDRYHFPDNNDPTYGGGPAERQQSAEGIKQRIDQRLSIPSNVNIDLSASLNDSKTAIKVTANCQRGKQFGDKVESITVYVTEDNIVARNQKGATGEYIHQHVLRAVNATWGERIDWVNNQTTYQCSLAIDEDWDIDQLNIVAFVSNYDSSDFDNCIVEQAETVKLSDGSSAIDNATAKNDRRVVARYSVDGSILNGERQGINILRLANGEVKKVFIR